MTTKVWNLMYVLGNTRKIVGDSNNPQPRKSALEGATTIDGNGWRVWVEHHTSGERIFESDREKAHRQGTTECASAPIMAKPRLADFILEHSDIEHMAELSACAAIDVLRDWPREGDVTYRFKDESKLTMEAGGSATTN